MNELVSVVLTVTDTQIEFIDECFESLLSQTYENLQILVMQYGASAEVAAATRSYLAEDDRVELDDRTWPDLGRARNAGAQLAGGHYLAFVDGADRVPVKAYRSLVESLAESGSDFAGGRLTEENAPARSGRPPQLKVHRPPGTGFGVTDEPRVVSDPAVETRLFTADFWKRADLGFPDSGATVLALPMIRSLLNGARFDVLARVTYQKLHRGDGLPLGHQRDAMPGLPEWLSTQEQIAAALEGATEIREAWLSGVLDSEVIPFLDGAERATPEEWKALSAGVRSMLDDAGPAARSRVRAESRVKVWLAANGKRTELEEFVARRWYTAENKPTHVADGMIYARLPFFGDATVGVPDEFFVLSPDETALTASLRRVRWVDDATLELQVFAFIPFVDMATSRPDTTITLVEQTQGSQVELPVRQSADPAANRFAAHRFQSYESCVFTARVDARLLAEQLEAQPSDCRSLSWSLQVQMGVRGIVRAGRLSHVDVSGSAMAVERRPVSQAVVGLRVRSDRDVQLKATRVHVFATSVAVEGRTVRATLESTLDDQLLRVRAETPGAKKVTGKVTEGRFELELPDLGPRDEDGEPRTWTLWVRAGSRSYPLAWPDTEHSSWIGVSNDSDVAIHRTDRGHCELVDVRFLPEIERVRIEGTQLVVDGRWLGPAPERWTLELEEDRSRTAGEKSADDTQRFQVRFSLMHDRWGITPRPLPSGSYRLRMTVGEGGTTTYLVGIIGDELSQACPVESRSTTHRLRVHRTTEGLLAINLSSPLADDERGPFAQQQLQDWFTRQPHALDGSAVYLQAYTGESATDSPLAIHTELRRRRPDLTLYWGVADLSAAVPEGAVPVLLRSRRWYEALATSKYLVNNADFDAWFAKQPGQKFLQTFHGYPSKTMGLVLWKAKQFTPRQVALELDKTSALWDLILTPTPEMDRYYREEYRYTGQIHHEGYPRDDVLTSGEADAVREDTRRRLGIADDQTVVLYAPTWRDHLAARFHSTRIAKHLDLESASAALGEGYVLLMRGHRFHARANERATGGTRILDVTDYPEVNDLILAADVAVLDYSSIRFDFGLTAKPMIFLVPDLDLYTGGVRGFLFDYRSTAPGPLLDTAEGVVDALMDLRRTASDYADQRRRFNERYHYWQDGRATERVVTAFFGDEPPGKVSAPGG